MAVSDVMRGSAGAGAARGSRAAGDAVREARDGLGGSASLVLSDEAVAALVAALGAGTPLAGAYTHGEVGRIRGAKGDRNHALVVAALG